MSSLQRILRNKYYIFLLSKTLLFEKSIFHVCIFLVVCFDGGTIKELLV